MKRIGVLFCGTHFLDENEKSEAIITLNALKIAPEKADFPLFILNELIVNKEDFLVEENSALSVVKTVTGLTSDPLNNPAKFDQFVLDGLIILSANSVPVYKNGRLNSAISTQEIDSVADQLQKIHKQHKTIAFIGKSALWAPLLIGSPVRITLGNDPDHAELIDELGGEAVICPADDIVVDEEQGVISTPGFLGDQDVENVSHGIHKLLTRILGV